MGCDSPRDGCPKLPSIASWVAVTVRARSEDGVVIGLSFRLFKALVFGECSQYTERGVSSGFFRSRSSAPQAHRPPSEWACDADGLRLRHARVCTAVSRSYIRNRCIQGHVHYAPGGPGLGLNRSDRLCLCP